jgi:hypothetical protein
LPDGDALVIGYWGQEGTIRRVAQNISVFVCIA